MPLFKHSIGSSYREQESHFWSPPNCVGGQKLEWTEPQVGTKPGQVARSLANVAIDSVLDQPLVRQLCQLARDIGFRVERN
jgi:hypothetical protein